MQIDNDTTAWQIAELMGTEADERDGKIMMGIILREGYTDIDEISSEKWSKFLDEAAATRRDEDAA